MANCFVNMSFSPSRNGTCPGKIFRFHWLGFERENIKRGNPVAYPFPKESVSGPSSVGAGATPAPPRPAAIYTVFTRGDKIMSLNQTVGCFRIPSLVRTPKGTLLAFAEGRVNGCRPDVAADRPLVVRSSSDDGATWGDVRVAVPANKSYGTNYPAATVLPNGEILLTFFKSSGPPGGSWSTRSIDDGITWSEPVQMTGGCAAFPAVVLSNRLVAPCSSFASISEDGGRTWRRSQGNITMGPNITGLGESVLVADGRGANGTGLSMFIRSGSNNGLQTHSLAQSEDGGETWGQARLLPIVGVTCQGAVGHDPTAKPGSLLLSAPSWPAGGLNGRRNMSLWTLDSTDPNTSPISRMTMGWGLGAGYSDFDTTGGKIRLIYESGPPHVYDYGVQIAHINNF